MCTHTFIGSEVSPRKLQIALRPSGASSNQCTLKYLNDRHLFPITIVNLSDQRHFNTCRALGQFIFLPTLNKASELPKAYHDFLGKYYPYFFWLD